MRSKEDIEKLRIAGRHLAEVLDILEAMVVPGIPVSELNRVGEVEIRKRGDTPALLNYQPYGAFRPFPASVCVSVNDVAVHGIPTESDYVLKEGDIVGIDSTLWHENVVADSARTVSVGNVDESAALLIATTKEALDRAIEAARVGNTTGDIGYAVESVIDGSGFSIIEELCGHGVGYAVHEAPQVPNFGHPGTGTPLSTGMVLAIEPMINEGTKYVKFMADGYTVKTKDGKRSAHFEHTVLITEKGPEIITRS